jgi:hypothetical protein
MNANELADLLDKATDTIEKLKKEIEYWKEKFNKAMELNK